MKSLSIHVENMGHADSFKKAKTGLGKTVQWKHVGRAPTAYVRCLRLRPVQEHAVSIHRPASVGLLLEPGHTDVAEACDGLVAGSVSCDPEKQGLCAPLEFTNI